MVTHHDFNGLFTVLCALHWDLTRPMEYNTEVAHRHDSHSRDEVIPLPRLTSSVNAGFSRPLDQ
jgi:hypothetical protein